MNTNRRDFEIRTGPSRDLLFDAAKYAYDDGKVIPVEFLIPIAYTMPLDNPNCACVPMEIEGMKIVSVQHEDGSGNSFNIEGFCKAALTLHSEMKFYRFEAYYNSKTRKGRIEFIVR